MNPHLENLRASTRRHFLLRQCPVGLGGMALAALTGGSAAAARVDASQPPLADRAPRLAGRAKRVVFLHMAGAPSQLDLFDYKPELSKRNGQG
jgi:hypothetical protein